MKQTRFSTEQTVLLNTVDILTRQAAEANAAAAAAIDAAAAAGIHYVAITERANHWRSVTWIRKQSIDVRRRLRAVAA